MLSLCPFGSTLFLSQLYFIMHAICMIPATFIGIWYMSYIAYGGLLMQVQQLFFIALAGACGAVSRFALAEFVYVFFGRSLPYGTFIVNILGCFLFGIVWDLYSTQSIMRESTRLIILVGFMGSFTTFSTLIFESDVLIREGLAWTGIANMIVSLLMGIFALRLGLFTSSYVRSVLGSVF